MGVYSRKTISRFEISSQHPIGRYIADFYCPQKNLVIELEGKVHQLKDQKEYDKARKEAIEAIGLKILYFSNEEIFNNLEEVLTRLTSPPESPSPRVERGTVARPTEVIQSGGVRG